MERRRALLVLLAIAFTVFTAVRAEETMANSTSPSSTASSFCEACRDHGDCAQAYNGSQGFYCGARGNATGHVMTCCCPATGQCPKTLSNTACLCGGATYTPTKKPKPTMDSAKWTVLAGAIAGVGLLSIAVFFYCNRASERDDDATDYVGQESASTRPTMATYEGSQSHHDREQYQGSSAAASGFVGVTVIDLGNHEATVDAHSQQVR